ncbi:LexA family protein [Methylobacterium brachiatum]
MTGHRIDELLFRSPEAVRVPLIGHALCAGFPSPADDFLESALELPRWLVPNPPATFLWRISGNSMEGAGIYDRDLACVDRSLKAGHGSIVVAAIDGQMSAKRLVIERNFARLAFRNLDLPAFAVDELSEDVIWGVVRFSIRWHVARGHMT